MGLDAEHRHNALFGTGKFIEAGCNAHGRRKVRDAKTSQPVLAAEAGGYIAAIFRAEDKARKAGLTGKKLLKWRRKKIPPLME